jgi:hypothetical protein
MNIFVGIVLACLGTSIDDCHMIASGNAFETRAACEAAVAEVIKENEPGGVPMRGACAEVKVPGRSA